jgi:hypothetical protein
MAIRGIVQQKDSYSGSNNEVVRVVGDIIHYIDPMDTPVVAALGGFDAARGKFDVRLNGKKIELLEDEYAPLTASLLAGGATDMATDDTQFTFATTTVGALQDGSMILIDAEYLVVSAVAPSTGVVGFYSRDFGGTNATHDSSASVAIVGQARLEGDDADFVDLVDIGTAFNYTSIFEKALNLSGTDIVLDYYGMGDSFSYQAGKVLPEMFRWVELGLFHSQRQIGTTSVPRAMGGLDTFIGSNTVAAGGGIAKSDVDNLAEAIYLDGGQPDLLLLHPSVVNDLKALLDSSSFVRITQAEGSILGTKPMRGVSTQWGDLTIISSRFQPLATGYILDSRKVGLYELRPFAWHELAKTGDSKKGEMIGELSLLVANNEAHGTITGITS